MEGGAAVHALLGPVEHGLDAPAGAWPGGPHLPLPAVEGAGLLGGPYARGDGGPRVVGPQPPGTGFEGVSHGRGQFGLALGVGREAREHRGGEGAQAGVVVAQGEFVEGPGPVAALGGVPAQQVQGVLPAVGREVPQDGEGEPGA